MPSTPQENHGNLTLLRGGAPRRPTTPRRHRVRTALERELDQAIAEVFYAMRGANNKVPGRAFYDIAELTAFPLRILARRMIGWKYLHFVDRVYDTLAQDELDHAA